MRNSEDDGSDNRNNGATDVRGRPGGRSERSPRGLSHADWAADVAHSGYALSEDCVGRWGVRYRTCPGCQQGSSRHSAVTHESAKVPAKHGNREGCVTAAVRGQVKSAGPTGTSGGCITPTEVANGERTCDRPVGVSASSLGKKKKVPPPVPCDSLLRTRLVRWEPRAGFSDPTTVPNKFGDGLAIHRPIEVWSPKQVLVGPAKKVRVRLEHRRGTGIIGPNQVSKQGR